MKMTLRSQRGDLVEPVEQAVGGGAVIVREPPEPTGNNECGEERQAHSPSVKRSGPSLSPFAPRRASWLNPHRCRLAPQDEARGGSCVMAEQAAKL